MGDLEETRRRSEAQQLISRVVRGLRLASFGHAWSSALFVLGVGGCVLLLVRRLSGLGPEWLTFQTLAGLPVGAALVAVLFSRKPARFEAARRIDQYCGTNDLFLTLKQLDSSAGEYQSLILEQAELLAAKVVSGAVVQWNWRRPVVRSLVMAGVLIAAMLFIPQFDPFGVVDTATAAVAVRKDLQQSRRETAARITEIAARRDSKSRAGDLDRTLSELAADLQQLRNDRSSLSLKELAARQREIETQWRALRTGDEVSRLLEQSSANQSFGPVDQRARQWASELANGKTDSLDEAISSLRENLEQLPSTSDEAERQQLEQQTRKEIAELQRFAENQLQSRPTESALKRAMSQLDSGRLDPSLRSEATDAAKESLELAEAELQDIAQQAGTLASLENALGAIQSARQSAQQNSQQDTDRNEARVQEFIDQYAKMQGDVKTKEPATNQPASAEGQPNLSEQQASTSSQAGSKPSGNTNGEKPNSTSGSGKRPSLENASGGSSSPPENDLARTGFRDAREASAIDAGRRLMTLRRQGLSESGGSSMEYKQLVRDLQQRVSTAIEVEEIPPGYVSTIRNYFDTLDEQSDQDESEQGPSGQTNADSNTPEIREADNDAP